METVIKTTRDEFNNLIAEIATLRIIDLHNKPALASILTVIHSASKDTGKLTKLNIHIDL